MKFALAVFAVLFLTIESFAGQCPGGICPVQSRVRTRYYSYQRHHTTAPATVSKSSTNTSSSAVAAPAPPAEKSPTPINSHTETSATASHQTTHTSAPVSRREYRRSKTRTRYYSN